MLCEADFSNVAFPIQKNIEADKAVIIDVIKEVRKIRADNNIMPNKSIKLSLKPKKAKAELFDDLMILLLSGILKSEETLVIDKKPSNDNLVYGITKAWVEVFVDNSNALDVEAEIARLKEQISDTKEYIIIIDKKLLNESFVRNAPPNLVRAEMEKKQAAQEKLQKLEEKLSKFM